MRVSGPPNVPPAGLAALAVALLLASCGVATGSSDASLQGLEISTGVMLPGFDPTVLHYDVGPGLMALRVRVTPTATDPGAAISVGGRAVASGTRSAPIYLDVGRTRIDVVVTAADGVTTRTTTLDFVRTGLAGVRTVALPGEPAPVEGAPTWAEFGNPLVNDRGEVMFRGSFAGGTGLFLQDPAGTHLLLRTGQVAPNTGGARFDAFFGPDLGDGGHVAVDARFSSGTTQIGRDHALYVVHRATGLREVVRLGAPAPGVPDTVLNAFHGELSVNRLGRVAFMGHLEGEGAVGSNERPVFKEGLAGLELVARYGQPTPAGGIFTPVVGMPSLNDLGQAAFGASVSPAMPFGEAPDNALFVEKPFPLSGFEAPLIAGQRAPGVPGTEYAVLDVGPCGLNNAGYLALAARLRDVGAAGPGSMLALYKTRPGVPSFSDPFPDPVAVLLARGGGPAPGAALPFNGSVTNNLRGVAINDPGRVAFLARLEDDVPGVWAERRDGPMGPVVRGGEVLEVRPGDFRTIDTSMFSILYGGRSAFNDLGQVAFWARFTDGSQGIFVTVAPGTSPALPIPFLLDPDVQDPRRSASFAVGSSGYGTELPLFLELPARGEVSMEVSDDAPAFTSVLLTADPVPANQGATFLVRVGETTLEGVVGQLLEFGKQGLGDVRAFTLVLPIGDPQQPVPKEGGPLVAGVTFDRGGLDLTVLLDDPPADGQ